MSSGIKLCDW